MAHILKDVLQPGLRLVFCGTAAGTMSAAMRCYYAHPTNRFWRTLHGIGLTPTLLRTDEFPRLLEFGIGLTDLSKDQSGPDTDIRFASTARRQVRRKIARYQPEILAFNGKTAAMEFFDVASIEYGPHAEVIGRTRLWVLPSTSGRASRAWKLDPWEELARRLLVEERLMEVAELAIAKARLVRVLGALPPPRSLAPRIMLP